jgi:hypothetical protein
MQTFTTKAFSDLPDADEMRSNGPGVEVMILQNESETIELEALNDETSDWVGASWNAEGSPLRASLAGASEFKWSQPLRNLSSLSIATRSRTRS